jgi:hypothetical protein
MRYMVVETFLKGPKPVYEVVAKHGRMLPPGLEFIDSWIDERTLGRCFQLMETDDPRLFDDWAANWSQWNDLIEFEIVPVISTAEASERSRR